MAHQTVRPGTLPSLPTLADIQRRRAQLLGLPAEQQPAEPPPASANIEDPTEQEEATPSPWPTLAQPALHGLAGRLISTLAPHTEADPAAILLQFLAAFGNLAGPGPHCMVESTRHNLNLFVVLVGESSKARKGSSWRQLEQLFAQVDDPWRQHRVATARLSADGLIHDLRDQQPPTDRRLLLLSEEFASVLHLLGRQKAHLSPLLRGAWDTGNLRSFDRHHPLQATGTHISLIGHITQHELAHHLDRRESQNGFANRCLWTCVRRSQSLPDGGAPPAAELAALAAGLRHTLDWVRSETSRPFHRDPQARELWAHHYPRLSQERRGAAAAATSRAEAQVLRLSAIYSALDNTFTIAAHHLQAALAVWDYCAVSATLLFATTTRNTVADRINRALETAPEGLTREQLGRLFHGHLSAQRIDAALQELATLNLVHSRTEHGRGRPTTHWEAPQKPEPAPGLTPPQDRLSAHTSLTTHHIPSPATSAIPTMDSA